MVDMIYCYCISGMALSGFLRKRQIGCRGMWWKYPLLYEKSAFLHGFCQKTIKKFHKLNSQKTSGYKVFNNLCKSKNFENKEVELERQGLVNDSFFFVLFLVYFLFSK